MKKILPLVLSTFLILSGCASATAPAISANFNVPHSIITIQNLPPISIDKPIINVPDTHVNVNPNIIIKKIVIEPPKINLIINNPIIKDPVINIPIQNPKVDLPPLPTIHAAVTNNKDFITKVFTVFSFSIIFVIALVEYIIHRNKRKIKKRK